MSIVNTPYLKGFPHGVFLLGNLCEFSNYDITFGHNWHAACSLIWICLLFLLVAVLVHLALGWPETAKMSWWSAKNIANLVVVHNIILSSITSYQVYGELIFASIEFLSWKLLIKSWLGHAFALVALWAALIFCCLPEQSAASTYIYIYDMCIDYLIAYYNTRSKQKSPVPQQNAWFDTKKPGSTQKCPVPHENALPDMLQLTLPLLTPPPVRNIFSNSNQIFCF